jgi:hypothetical protein
VVVAGSFQLGWYRFTGTPENSTFARANGVLIDLERAKQKVRTRIWALLEQEGVAKPSGTVVGKIPNFLGAEAAAEQLAALPARQRAQVKGLAPLACKTDRIDAWVLPGAVAPGPGPRGLAANPWGARRAGGGRGSGCTCCAIAPR